ncbi:MAG: polysaccharide pyruvyl transferase family protein [Prevotella pallens]|jgi:exoV-like protein|nr:polysaccharide pyruvyl transferase family protein [Prevotella pallens]
MKRFILILYNYIIFFLPGILPELFKRLMNKDIIVLKGYLDMTLGIFHKQNWGDDMNVYLAQLWFNKKVINYSSSFYSMFFGKRNYSLIGSILQDADDRTIVWGSGLLYENLYPREQPKKIYAVRGPLSREVLIKHGINCPKVYGDPILLLPRYYHPQISKKYKIGIIPHFHDEENKLLSEYASLNNGIRIISMKRYKKWENVIDDILSCDLILSSSLHGLILSDAYGIKNVWIEFEKQAEDKKFKFCDYFASVHQDRTLPIIIKTILDFDIAKDKGLDYQPIVIDLKPLINNCPFTLPFS